ncbi:MAG: hypothetical protein KAT05_09555 [Spirochaetes bacterium]|nr:hypothetical protein [Spirochaetota bacterium]
MKEQLENIIKRFQDSQTSLESYQAISDFVEIIINIPEFIKQVEKEGEVIHNAKIALNRDKGDYSKEHNERRSKKHIALHQLDPIFPLRNLHNVYQGIKTENIANSSDWLFHNFSPDEQMLIEDKVEYQMFINKLYKKVIPFLEVKKEKKKNELKVKSYDEKTKTLIIGNIKILIAKNDGNNNAHEIMAYIFVDNKSKLSNKFYYSEIAKYRFEAPYNSDDKYAHQMYSGACKRINDIIKDTTDGQIKEFLIFNYSSLGHIQVNSKYV